MENGYEYIVKEGDTLSDILYDLTGSANKDIYEKIASDNNIENADHIIPGQKIIIGQEYLNSNSNNTSMSSISENTSDSQKNETDNGNSLLFESEDQSELEQILTKEPLNEKEAEKMSSNEQTNDSKQNLTPQEKIASSTSSQNGSTNSISNNSNNNSNSIYVPSDYEICYPNSVSGFEPRDSFKTFQIKKNAGEHFVDVNNQVRKCGTDIDGIISSLTTLKTKMGENTGTTTQIDKITNALMQKKKDLITKNSELIKACNQVIEYVYENKSSKAEEATEVYNTIANINVYKG